MEISRSFVDEKQKDEVLGRYEDANQRVQKDYGQ